MLLANMPPGSYTVRPVLPQDIELWCSLRRKLWQHVGDDEHLLETRRLLSDQHRYATFIAISHDGAPVGFAEAAIRYDYVNGCKTSPVLFLEGIYVIPQARRTGIAKALCAAIGEWGTAHACTEFASDTQVDNIHAQALHRALGFEERERVVFFRKHLLG